MLACLPVWDEVQICIWPSRCHCHSLSLVPVNPHWFYLPGFTFLVLAHPGSPGQSQGGRKTFVVVVAVYFIIWAYRVAGVFLVQCLRTEWFKCFCVLPMCRVVSVFLWSCLHKIKLILRCLYLWCKFILLLVACIWPTFGMYTVVHKKGATFIFSITLANIDGFS